MQFKMVRWLPWCLMILAVGCGKAKSTKHVEVSGQVLFNGKPLTGGRITFVDDKGFSSEGTIDENGNYKLNAPVGDVRVAVDNRMLRNTGAQKYAKNVLKRPGSEDPGTFKGTYVQIPDKYYTPESSGLTYKVLNGTQTKNFELQS